MSRESFNNIAEIIRPQVEPTAPLANARAIASTGSVVKAELRLGGALRVLSGGSYLDAADSSGYFPLLLLKRVRTRLDAHFLH
jgi:hypothetical protein